MTRGEEGDEPGQTATGIASTSDPSRRFLEPVTHRTGSRHHARCSIASVIAARRLRGTEPSHEHREPALAVEDDGARHGCRLELVGEAEQHLAARVVERR